MCDEIDLSGAELFYDSNRGHYIPQHFAQDVDRARVAGVSQEDWQALEAGPGHDWYDESWCSVLDNAVLTKDDGSKWLLYQDGDLWIMPVTS